MSRRNAHRREPRFVSMMAVLVHDAYALTECMRYDSCFIATEAESHKVKHLIDGSSDDEIVRLYRVAPNDRPPTEDRWRSFDCHVLATWHPDESPPTDEYLMHLAGLAKSGALVDARRLGATP